MHTPNEEKDVPFSHLDIKEPWLAALLSFCCPGLGQWYAGHIKLGLFFFISSILVSLLVLFSIVSSITSPLTPLLLIIFLIVFFLFNIYNSFSISKKQNPPNPSLTTQKDPWLAFFLSNFIPPLGFIYLRKWGLSLLFSLIFIFLILSSKTLLVTVFSRALPILTLFVLNKLYREKRMISSSKKWIVIGLIVIPALSLGTSVFVKMYGFELSSISSSSMSPTFLKSDRLIIRKVQIFPLSIGDVVTFKSPLDPKKHFISRIVAKGGQQIEIKKGDIFLDHHLVQIRNAKVTKDLTDFGPIVLPPNSYFMMGDNRDNAFDSRYFGPVPEKDILGKPVKKIKHFFYFPYPEKTDS